MATVGTSSQSELLGLPTVPSIARDMSTGGLADYMYAIIRTGTDTLTVYRTTNEGSSWSSFASFTHTGLQEWSAPVVDRGGYLHIAYRIGTGSADTIWYRRCNLNTASFTSAVQVSSTDANGGTIGSRWQGVELAVVYSGGTYQIAVCGAYANGSTNYGMIVMGVTINSTGTINASNGIIANNRFFLESGTYPGRSGVSCEVEHNGDGYTASTPHLWVAWGRTKLRMVKLAWTGSGWSGPSSFQVVKTPIANHDYVGGRWDGSQWMMTIISPDDATMVRLYQRNQANTLTTQFDTPTHPTGNIRAMVSSYDNSTKNIRVFAVGTSTGVLYSVDYNRSAGTWGSWTSVVATAIGPSVGKFSVRRGGSADNAKIDVLTSASGSPNTVTHTGMATVTAPYVAVMLSPTGRYNGGPADVASALFQGWLFYDTDPGQTQGSYALSRQIGTGTVAYWRASDSTWQPAEVQNSSTVASVTQAAGWGADSDAAYTFRVKVWDSGGLPAAGYSDPYVVIPSAVVNPTITAPTGGGTITTDKVTATWTVAQQTKYQVTLATNPGGVVVYTSGWIAGSDLTYTVPYSLANGTGWTLSLTTQNTEGLSSATQTVNFTVQYTSPPVPYSTLTPTPASGYIVVTSNANAQVGSQPTLDTVLLQRRPTVTTINSNPTFNGNTTGYSLSGTATLSYSTAQFAPYSSPGSARAVPTASSTSVRVETGGYVITPGKLYIVSGWVRPDTANKAVQVAANWLDSGGTYITTVSTSSASPVAGAWQYFEAVFDPSLTASAARISAGLGLTGTPTGSDGFYVDEVRIREYSTTGIITVATGLTHPATVNDWGAVSGVDYEYRWLGVGGNGTSITGPWQS